MFTKEEASLIKETFWKTFGQYMSYIPSADGRPRINWINYKTGVRSIQFRMFADKKDAYISLTIFHKDAGMQTLLWEQLVQLEKIIKAQINSDWQWLPYYENENGQLVCGLFLFLSPANIFDQKQWPTLISFFKHNMLLLDHVWESIQFAFDDFKHI